MAWSFRVCILLSLFSQVFSLAPTGLGILDFASTSAIDKTPRFAWKNDFQGRNASQYAYQILVSTGDRSETLWDSGKVLSNSNVGIEYSGPALAPASAYTWAVKSWNARTGEGSDYSTPMDFTTGFFSTSQWDSSTIWIAAPQSRVGLINAYWVEANGTIQKMIDIAGNRNISSALTSISATTPFSLQINGIEVISSNQTWSSGVVDLDVALYLQPGSNTVTLIPSSGAQGVIMRTEIRQSPVDFLLLVTDSTWTESDGSSVEVVAPYYAAPWSTWEILKYGGSVNDKPPMMRRVFQSRDLPISRATLYISGLGVFEAFINGQRIGNNVIDQTWTDYSFRTTYTTFDVKDLLNSNSDNVLGAMLGNGWYDYQTKSVTQKWGLGEAGIQYIKNYGVMRLWAQLNIVYSDGSSQVIGSDGNWTTFPSPWTSTNVYGSEAYNFALEQSGWTTSGFDDSHWMPAQKIENVPGTFESQRTYGVKVQATYPGSVIASGEGYVIYDIGVNINGQVEVTTSGSITTYNIIPGERIESGRVYPFGNGVNNTAKADYITDSTVTTSDEEVPQIFRQTFSSNGFRYIQIQSAGSSSLPTILNVTGYWVYNDAPQTGYFESSNSSYNRVYDIVLRTMLNNFVSIHTDCPQYEKLGWQEVVANLARGYSFAVDAQSWQSFLLSNTRDAQLSNGLVPSIAPSYTEGETIYYNDPLWGNSIFVAPWSYYRAYGDVKILQDNYPAAKAYYTYLQTQANNSLVEYGLGDWVGPAGQNVPNTEAATVVRAAAILYSIATLLGETTDAAAFEAESQRNRNIYNSVFLSRGNCTYQPATQVNQAMPLAYDFLSTNTSCAETRLVDIINSPIYNTTSLGFGPVLSNHLTTGENGLLPLITALQNSDRGDLVETLLFQPDLPGFVGLLNQDQTTLPEQWAISTARSLNHDMFAVVLEWFYTAVGGISETSGGFSTFDIRPDFNLNVTSVNVTFSSIRGQISSSWSRNSSMRTHWAVRIPPDTQAHLWFPAANVTAWVDGEIASASIDGIQGWSPMTMKLGRYWTEAVIGSGDYTFIF